jgi:hypothetical protein
LTSETPPSGQPGAQVVDLAGYRVRREAKAGSSRRDDQEFYAACAAYLRRRADEIGDDPDGVRRLAIAFDLRRVKMRDYLTSALAEEDIADEAAAALRNARQLPAMLTAQADPAAARVAAYRLAEVLDTVITALGARSGPAPAKKSQIERGVADSLHAIRRDCRPSSGQAAAPSGSSQDGA